ncbi:MAG: hypothetical protein PHW04_00100 [Candidatus Wallbacteria bacterium]|nr:hypothetical protein [Candidatus Wallbacteria bacterium]
MKGIFLALLLVSAFNLAAKDYSIGTKESFWQFDPIKGADSMEAGYYQADFTCRKIGEHTIMFVEDKLKPKDEPSPEFIDKLCNRFDAIYPVFSDYFGQPTDLDHNGKFIILTAAIRDWFYYSMEVTADMKPILGYYWLPFNQRMQVDYLTMASVQPEIDAYGTMAHEFTHNIYDNANPEPVNFIDRAITESLAQYAIYLNGTLDQDSYFQWELSILKKDLVNGKMLNAFDGTHDYFDIGNSDTHHCYAVSYYFLHYVADYLLASREMKMEFFETLINEKVNDTSMNKMTNALIKMGLIKDAAGFNDFYFKNFKDFLFKYFNIAKGQ